MKKKDLFLILVLVLAAAVVLVVGLSGRHGGQQGTTETPALQNSETPGEDSGAAASDGAGEGYSDSVMAEAAAYFEKNPAESYLVVRTSQASTPPIPLNEEYSFTVQQPDGSENVIHVGVNSFHMESSNCDNQNCVEEGTVTLENMNQRVLINMIYCLPHQLSLEMLTPDEARGALLEMLSQQEAMQAAANEAEKP